MGASLMLAEVDGCWVLTTSDMTISVEDDALGVVEDEDGCWS